MAVLLRSRDFCDRGLRGMYASSGALRQLLPRREKANPAAGTANPVALEKPTPSGELADGLVAVTRLIRYRKMTCFRGQIQSEDFGPWPQQRRRSAARLLWACRLPPLFLFTTLQYLGERNTIFLARLPATSVPSPRFSGERVRVRGKAASEILVSGTSRHGGCEAKACGHLPRNAILVPATMAWFWPVSRRARGGEFCEFLFPVEMDLRKVIEIARFLRFYARKRSKCVRFRACNCTVVAAAMQGRDRVGETKALLIRRLFDYVSRGTK